jgi:salicylate hydroxylase
MDQPELDQPERDRAQGEVDVVIVGGGIGGLANALALARAGLRVRVLEQAPVFGEVGAGLQIAPNASRILRDWGLLPEVIARGVLPGQITMRDALDGSVLTSLDLRDVQHRYGAPYVVIHRSDLHEILLTACRQQSVDLVTGAAVEYVDVSGTSAATVTRDGRRDTASIVVAADGLQSALRRHLSDDEPVNSGYVAYRGAVPLVDLAGREGLALDEVVLYIGPGCHFVHYPLRGGEMLNQVAVFRSPKAARGEPEWGGPDELDAAFAATCDDVKRCLPALWRDRWWQMYDRVPIATWVDRRLVLTGDAAHPMLQYLAQGACQAIEDASGLATAVDKASAGRARSGDRRSVRWDEALRDYNDSRAERTARVQATARFWGEFWHCDGMARTVRNALLTERATRDYRYIDWLYAR